MDSRREHSGVALPALVEISDSVERLIGLARSIDFDLLHGRGEPLGRLVAEARFLATVTADAEVFELSQELLDELRRRRGLPRSEA